MVAPFQRSRKSQTHRVDEGYREESNSVELGRAVGVTGSTGAPGRTFMSINLAVAIHALGKRVVLVDADPHLGAVAVQLDLAEDRSLVYLAHEAKLRRVDDTLVSRHIQSASGLDVLTGRAVAGLGNIVPGSLLADVVGLLRRRYDVVVVDVGALDCRDSQQAALLCQLLVWVAVPTKMGTDLLDRTLSGPLAGEARTRPSLVVLNRLGSLSLREVDTAMRRRYGMAVAGAVPDRPRACLQAEDSARPAVQAGPLAPPLSRLGRVVASALRASDEEARPGLIPLRPKASITLVGGGTR